MTGGTQRFATRVPRDDSGLLGLADWVTAVSESLALSVADSFALRLCIEEVVANLVMHAVSGEGSDTIGLSVHTVADGLLVNVEDTCLPFDPMTVRKPGPEHLTETAGVGGLGIHLLRQYARDIEYSSQAGTNTLSFTTGVGG